MYPARFRCAIAAAVLGLIVAVPASAGASPARSIWVSSATVAAADDGCGAPGFNTIQSAIAAAPSGATIRVCAGTYVEQLAITRSLTLRAVGAVVIRLPPRPVDSRTACDTKPGTGTFKPDQDGIVVCGDVRAAIDGLTIDAAWPRSTCDDSLFGVLVAGGATLDFSGSRITAAGAVPLNGCQGGIGIQIGMAWTAPVEIGHAVLRHDRVSGYQKNGIEVDGAGSTARIDATRVRGAGATKAIVQNGIEVNGGAFARITGSTIVGNRCDARSCGPNSLRQSQSAGVLFIGAARDSAIARSTLAGNDIGVYNLSTSAGAPSAPTVSITANRFSGDRREAILLDQGFAAIDGDQILGGGAVGIQILQDSLQSYAARGSARSDRIMGMSRAAVQVLSDHATGDPPGSSMIARSVVGDSAANVLNDSSNYRVGQRADT
jgi:hypothetical protein